MGSIYQVGGSKASTIGNHGRVKETVPKATGLDGTRDLGSAALAPVSTRECSNITAPFV